MKKVKSLILFIFIFYSNFAYANNEDFNNWLKDFKKIAIKNNISEDTFELVMKNVKGRADGKSVSEVVKQKLL